MGILLSSFGKPAGALNDGDALFGLDIVCDLTVLVSVSASLTSVCPSFGTDEADGVCASSIKTGDWRSIGESALGGVVFSAVFTFAARRRLFLRP